MKRLLAFVVAVLTGGAVLTASPATGFTIGQTACRR